jgi:hypothetical protein
MAQHAEKKEILNFYFHHIYMEYIESIGFTPKILKFVSLKSCFLPIKSHKTWKKAIKIFRLSEAVAAAAVDRNLCSTYSPDHKT